jgi:hypothetical protein
MSLAHAVQQQFYEIPRPQIEVYDFAAAAFPADTIGGDDLDFITWKTTASASPSATIADTASAPHR